LLKHASSDLKADKGLGVVFLFNLRFEIDAVYRLWIGVCGFSVCGFARFENAGNKWAG
jgi:hypothetical protein